MKLDISDRKGVFYWQTDRKMAVEDFERIFLKRQSITDDEIIRVLKEGITFTPVTSFEIETPDQNVISGNVNIVRKIVINGKKYLARLHPKAVKNGYFFVEKVAWLEALKRDLPVPEPLDVHESTHDDDMDFIIVKLYNAVE